MTSVLVTAARGKTGREVTSLLGSRAGVTVRAASRDPGTLAADGAQPVRFDWHDPATWEAALDGVQAIYLVRPEIEDAPERLSQFLATADGAENVVLLSELGAEELQDSTWERRVELAVSDQAGAWTILRPNWFAQTLTDEGYYLEPIRAGEIHLATGGAAVSLLDTRDIAAVAVEALLGRDHAGQTYALTGTEAITFGTVAAKLTAALGRPVRHVELSIDDNIAQFFGGEGDPFTVEMVRDVLKRLHDGAYARLTDDVKQVSGREPRSIDAFIQEHARLWKLDASVSR